MGIREVGFAAVAVASSSAAVVGLAWWFEAYEARMEQLAAEEDSVYVVVAARDLYQGVEVEEADLYAVQYPASKVPDGVFLTPQHVLGRVPRERILANEFVRAERLAQPELGQGLHAVIPRGQRALSIDLANGEALQGVLSPGSYVDVLVTVASDAAVGKAQTETLLQAVYVLGVDSRQLGESTEKGDVRRGQQRPSVTLLVSADDAETVAHARQVGEVRLVLRSGVDLGVRPDLTGVRCGLQPCPTTRTVAPQAAALSDCVEVELIRGPTSEILLVHPDGTMCE